MGRIGTSSALLLSYKLQANRVLPLRNHVALRLESPVALSLKQVQQSLVAAQFQLRFGSCLFCVRIASDGGASIETTKSCSPGIHPSTVQRSIRRVQCCPGARVRASGLCRLAPHRICPVCRRLLPLGPQSSHWWKASCRPLQAVVSRASKVAWCCSVLFPPFEPLLTSLH